ncbi:hypothetical protein QJQ45_026233 [Haematococcus lacustris]|nr:hypothetical protein QJQ45_026233 [Haematococcus lacustris]
MAGYRLELLAVLQHVGLMVLLVLVAGQVMHLAVVVCASPDSAFMITVVWAVINMFFAGFFVSPDQLALPWLAPLQYLSAIRLVLRGVLTLELSGTTVSCGSPQQVQEGLEALAALLPSMGALVEFGATSPLRAASGASGNRAGSELLLPYLKNCQVSGPVLLGIEDSPGSTLWVQGIAGGSLAALALYWLGLHLVTCLAMAVKWPRKR